MISLPPQLLDSFLVFDVRDPDELGEDSPVSRRFPSNNNVHRYYLKHAPPRAHAQADGVLTRLAMRAAGDLLVGYVSDRFATEVRIAVPGYERFCVSAMLGGTLTLHTANGQETLATGPRGLVLRSEPGTTFRGSDDNARFNLWVRAHRLEGMLVSLLGDDLARPLDFEPGIDFSQGPGASVLRLLGLFAHELAQPDGLASNPLALASFTDLWAHTLLHGLPHNHRDALARRRPGIPVPRHVKRAEAYMREHAARATTLSEVAAAAGCSLRTLHAAFRSFRDTTPLAALQAIRLDAVRAQLESNQDARSVTEIARLNGFSNAGRFKAAYQRRFGVPPPGSRWR